MNAFLTAAVALLLSGSLASACPVPLPKGVTVIPVANNIVTSGLVMSISQVSSKDSVQAVLDATEKAWGSAGFAVRRQQVTGWQVVSAKGNNCLATLQLNERNGSFGYLSHSKKSLVTAVSAQSRGVPLPGDAKVLSSVASDDDGRRGLVVSMTSAASMDEVNRHFLQAFSDNHWQAPRSHKITNGKTHVTSLFLSAQRGRERVEIVAWDEKATQIMMTISEAL